MAVLEDGKYCEHCNDDADEVCSACGTVRPSPTARRPLKRLLAWFSEAIHWDRVPH
jgi:hypothetical protein